ncbi:MAG: hypothetical protein CMF49_05865 [Legionellales bacterium]|nr:hypothetical protein [Legionellales bacterium]|tara:strand:- start:289 stop:561 length:273 start_codon:yes stop_codon:yes gene_type:complete
MFKKIVALTSICLFLAACSSSYVKGPDGVLRDSNADIQKAYSVKPLKTPPGMKPIPNDPYYVVPGATSIEDVTPVSLLPPDSLAAKQAKN